MSEIGTGSGSSYPTALDTNDTAEVNSPNSGKTKARAEVVNDLAAATVAIQTELGIDPAGTLTDVKTFLQTEHNTDGTHSDKAEGVKSVKDQGGGTDLKCKVIDIGDWDMVATSLVTVVHGLTDANIRNVQVFVRNDSGLTLEVNNLIKDSVGTSADGSYYITGGAVWLRRVTGGAFDSIFYDETSYNRGWITIWYV